jgi:peptidyl-prolyl cis-trans isomerase D
MLGALRIASQNWIGRVVFAILLLLMIIGLGNFGVSYVSVNFGANQLLRVGSTDVGIETYQEAYRRALQNLQQRLRRGITDAQARQFGLDRQVLSQVLNETILDQEAKSLGLAMSDKDLGRTIVDDSRFKGPGGTFDRRGFELYWRENFRTEDDLDKELRREYLRDEQTAPLQQGLEVPTAMLEAMNRYANETRSIDYIVLAPAAIEDIEAPSADALQAYYTVRQNLYRTPEYRGIVTLSLTPAALAKTIAVTDADIEKRYNDVKAARYAEPERRKIEQIMLPDEAAAAAASAKIVAGENFEQVAGANNPNDKPTDLGTVAKTALVDKAAADAAFSLPEGAVSAPVKTNFGWALLHVTSIVPAHEKPLADVKADIEKELVQAKARQEIGRLRDLIEKRRTEGKTLAEAAADTGLTPRTIDNIDANGRDTTGQPVADLADPEALLKAVFASYKGVDNEPIDSRDGGTTWFEVTDVKPAKQQTLEEVKPLLEQAWRQDERGRRLAAKATDIVKKLKDGEKLEAVAAAEGNLPIKHDGGVKRAGVAGFSQNAVVQIFNVNVGEAGSAPDETGGRIVFRVLDAAVPPLDAQSPDFAKLAAQVKGTLNNDVVGEYLADSQGRLGVSFNQRALQSLLSGGQADTQ